MSFAVHADPWLTEVMRTPAFRVEGVGATEGLASHLAGQGRAFYFAKVATEFPDEVSALAHLGFNVVDTNVTFELAREVDVVAELDVGEIRADEHDAVLDIAGSAFRFSRFHLDPLIGHDVANHIKREWVRNYILRKRGDALLVARDRTGPLGFLAALVANGTAVIDLVAASTAARGKRVGSALTAAFVARYRNMPRIVGTQIANVPSIRLYTKLGFVLARSHYVLHLHHADR